MPQIARKTSTLKTAACRLTQEGLDSLAATVAFTGSGYTPTIPGVPSRCSFHEHFNVQLPEGLAEKGLSADAWDMIQQKLRVSKGMTELGPQKGFGITIEQLNAKYFEPIGCIAVQAEFGVRQKAMTVFTKEAWAAKAD